MPLGQESAAGVYRYPASQGGGTVLQQADFFTSFTETKLYIMLKFIYGESIVKFTNINVFRPQTGHFVGVIGAFKGHIGKSHILPVE